MHRDVSIFDVCALVVIWLVLMAFSLQFNKLNDTVDYNETRIEILEEILGVGP